MGYMTNFIVYVFAMMGVIMLALFVFKHATGCKINSGGVNKSLKVLDTLNLTPRKTLYVVSAGKEKFLIAGDSERTTLISKLESSEHMHDSEQKYVPSEEVSAYSLQNYNDTTVHVSRKENYMDRSVLGINSTNTSPYESVMKSLAEKIKG